jgi:hypothetical protein
VGGSPDVLAFDASLGRLYVASQIGEVAVFGERGRLWGALTRFEAFEDP